MNLSPSTCDYEGSYLLGEADGENWATEVHPNEAQSLSLLSAEDIGQRDIFGNASASFLQEQAHDYRTRDTRFDAYAYFEGFLAAVRRTRQARAFAFSTTRARR
jgi:hypothetical protein